MFGITKTHLPLLYVVFCALVTCNAHTDPLKPTIHTMLLQKNTTIPGGYRNLPLVGKCCDEHEVLMKNGNGNAVCKSVGNSSSTFRFSPFFTEFNRSGMLVPGDERSEFVAIVGDPCEHNRYMLYPEESSEDEYHLLLNGSIFAPHHFPSMLQPGEDYCMEFVPEFGLRALVCFPEYHIVTTADTRTMIYACGLLISVPFLILTIVAYSITPKLKSVQGKALCCYCGCLALAFSILAFTQLGSISVPDNVCVCLAFVIQFSFLACFFWQNVMSIEMWLLIRCHADRERCMRMKPETMFFLYSLWGWGPSVILIIVSMAMDLSPTVPSSYVKSNFGKEGCSFRSDNEAMRYYYAPIAVLLVINLVLFVSSCVKMTKYQQELAIRRLARNVESDQIDLKYFRRLRRLFVVCLIIFLPICLNWTFEVITWWIDGDPLAWSIFDLVNALQGLLVFGLFVLRRPPRDFVWQRIQKIRGIDVADPKIDSVELRLLSDINGNAASGQTILP